MSNDQVVLDLKARLNRVTGLLAHIEWNGQLSGRHPTCPECGRTEAHTDVCELRIILDLEGVSTLTPRSAESRARYWEQQWEETRTELAYAMMELKHLQEKKL